MPRRQLTLGCATVAKYSIKGIIRNKTRGCGGGLTHTLRDTCENNSFHYYQASSRHTSGRWTPSLTLRDGVDKYQYYAVGCWCKACLSLEVVVQWLWTELKCCGSSVVRCLCNFYAALLAAITCLFQQQSWTGKISSYSLGNEVLNTNTALHWFLTNDGFIIDSFRHQCFILPKATYLFEIFFTSAFPISLSFPTRWHSRHGPMFLPNRQTIYVAIHTMLLLFINDNYKRLLISDYHDSKLCWIVWKKSRVV